jgi:hypothetical protein
MPMPVYSVSKTVEESAAHAARLAAVGPFSPETDVQAHQRGLAQTARLQLELGPEAPHTVGQRRDVWGR